MGAQKLDKAKLINKLKLWVDDPEVLDRARKFLEPAVRDPDWGRKEPYEMRGLGEVRIANWKRRGIPDCVIEGAALYHCAETGGTDDSAQRRTGLVAEDFWQVFVVGTERDERKAHDCTLYRYWSAVERAVEDAEKESYLVHKTWFTGQVDADPGLLDIARNRKLRRDHDWRPIGDGKEVAISLKVAGSQPESFGYRVHLQGTVDSEPPGKQRHEYLGGLSAIPAGRMFLVASIPHSLLARSTDILPDSRFKRVQCLEFLADGIPIHVLEEFLQPNREARWVSPWFTNRGEARIWRQDEIVLPFSIAAAMDRDRVSLVRPDCETFVFMVESPAAYLYYSLVFELRRKPGETRLGE